MDETKGTQDITSEETKETSEKEPETFTEAQVVERERKAKSDVSSELGRVQKLNAELIKSSQTIQERLARKEREDDERELEEHRDEPSKITEIRGRQLQRQKATDLDDRERELKKSEDEHAEALKAVVESTKEQNAREIATRLNVEAKTLSKLAKFTDGSLEAIEDIAKDLPKKGETKTLTPDSGKTIGGGMSDEAFIAKIGSGEITLDKDAMARARKLGIVK